MDLGPLLRAHAFLRVEQPPALWEVAADDELLIRMLGELIVAALASGAELSEVILRVNNVELSAEDAGDSEGADALPAGQYVAMTLIGAPTDAIPITWNPANPKAPLLRTPDLDAAARAAGARWGYVTTDRGRYSITVFVDRYSPV